MKVLKTEEEKKKRKKRWREANKEKIREQDKQYREANKERKKKWYTDYQATPYGRAANLVNKYRRADRKYNRGECTIDADWIVKNIFSTHCVYCGEDDWAKLGCDRLDNTKPHTPDNVVCCCKECNVKKQKTPYKVYIDKINVA